MNERSSIPGLEAIPQLEIMYREHWEHSRHCEILILWFTNIYAAIVAAILVFIGELSKNQQQDSLLVLTGVINENQQPDFGPILVLVLFGFILSIFGFCIVIAQAHGHHNYIMNIVTICYRWNLMEFYANPRKPFYYKRVHRWFYEVTTALFIVLFLYYISYDWIFLKMLLEYKVLLPVMLILFWIFIEGVYQCKWRAYAVEVEDFKDALRNDTEGIYRDNWERWFKGPEFWKAIAEDVRKRKIKEEEEEEKECMILRMFCWICRILNWIFKKLYEILCWKSWK